MARVIWYLLGCWLTCALANAGMLRERNKALSWFVAFTFALLVTACWPLVMLKVLGDSVEQWRARRAYRKAAAATGPGRMDA
jgi:hypothetical protein